MTAIGIHASRMRNRLAVLPWAGVLLTITVWAILFLPPAGLQNLHFEEGRRALMARDILERQEWLDPRILGVAYLKKPPLLPMLIAFFGSLLAEVNEWAVRFPPLLATLGMSLTTYWLVRTYAGRGAALFGALATMLTPMVMLKAALGETDTTATALCFLAFVIYWRLEAAGRMRLRGWLLCGAVLGLAALTKGPIPLVYPALGIAAVRLPRHGTRGLGGLLLALALVLASLAVWVATHINLESLELWEHEMRINQMFAAPTSGDRWSDYHLKFAVTAAAESLPTLLLALPALIPAWRRRLGVEGPLASALTRYALLGSIALCLGNAEYGRYALPAVPALGAAAGLVFERLRRVHPRRVALAAAPILALGLYAFVANDVMIPLRFEALHQSQHAAAQIDAAITADPAPVYLINDEGVDFNLVFYLQHKVTPITPDQPVGPGPAWVLIGGGGEPPASAKTLALPDQPSADVRSRENMRMRLYKL